MHQFTLNPQGIEKTSGKFFRRIVSANIVALILLCVWQLRDWVSTGTLEPSSLISIFIIGLLSIFSGFYYLRRLKRMLKTYKLTITNDQIIRESETLASLSIMKMDVKQITKTRNGGIVIIPDSKLNSIGVPAGIEHPERVEKLLSEIHPISQQSKSVTDMIIVGAMLLVFSAGILGSLDENQLISIVGASLTCVFLIAGFILIHSSKNFDTRIKRLSFIIAIPLACFIAVIVIRILGLPFLD